MNPSFDDLFQQWGDGCRAIRGLTRLFVVGAAKSGTTWVMNLLNGHPEIVVRGEGCFTYQLAPMLAQAFGAFNQHQKAIDPITHLRDLDLQLVLRTIIDSQFARYVAESDKSLSRLRVVGDKTPQHAVSVPALNQLCPTARFIHIIRDPRDVATSAWFHMGQHDPRPFEAFVEHFITQVWPINVGHARQAAGALGDRYMEIRYEDLHGDERRHVEQMLGFLGADASEAAIEACLASGDFTRRSGGRSRGQTDAGSFYRTGTAGDWRNHLPPELVETCCQTVAGLMTACGYDPAGAAVA